MYKDKFVEKLTALAHLDLDASLAYSQAIDSIHEDEIQQRLIEFRADHDRHVADLSVLIMNLGGAAPRLERGALDFVIEGMAAVAVKVGTRSTLVAMLQSEILTSNRYKALLKLELPVDVRALIEANYLDEQHHLAAIREVLKAGFGLDRVAQASQRPLHRGQEDRPQL